MKNILAAALLIAFAANANAAIVDNGNYTTDTVTGLDWLDLTETSYKSYDYVMSQLGTGGIYDGWQYATGLQFNTLLSNWAGKPVTSMTYRTNYTEGSDSIDGLVQLLGNVNLGNPSNNPLDINYSYGIIADKYLNNNNIQNLAMIYDTTETSSYFDFSDPYYGYLNTASTSLPVGSFLVRKKSWGAGPPSVPEASSLYLLAFGLIGLFAAARRKV